MKTKKLIILGGNPETAVLVADLWIALANVHFRNPAISALSEFIPTAIIKGGLSCGRFIKSTLLP